MADRRRTLLMGGIFGALLGLVLAPRRGESRRGSARRLQLALRSGRGSVAAFSGTPCAARADENEGRPAPAPGDEPGG